MAYFLKLCKPVHLRESLFNDAYYNSKQGIFNPNNVLDVVEEILVEPSLKKGYVKEVITKEEIPIVKLIIDVEDIIEKNYSYYRKGDVFKGIYAFEVEKSVLQNEIDEPFLKREATKKEIEEYQKKHANVEEWHECLLKHQILAKEEVKPYLKERKELMRQKKQKMVQNLKKILTR